MDAFFQIGGEIGALLRQLDWSRTPLGPPQQWPQSLRTIVRMMLTSRYAMWLGWGPELTMLYNDRYAQIIAGKHPAALGSPARDVWREIWDEIGPRVEQVLSTGQATFDEALLLLMERHGYREETYFTFSYSPLSDDEGRIAGNFCVVTEDTDRIIGERRLALLRDLATCLAPATSEEDVFRNVGACLALEARDLPFTQLYLFDADRRRARLVTRSGFSGEVVHGDTVDLDDRGAPWGLRDIAAGAPPAILACPSDSPRGRWDMPPSQVLVLPLAQQGQATAAAGAFVAGLNPYRPLDEGYRSFIGLIVGQIAAALANARAYEEERRRAEALAAIDHAKTAFFSNVSHEFRTPLTLMLGPTQDALASGGTLDRDQLETVYRNELRLLKLVNALLDFSRIEAGRTRASYQPVDLAALTADLASTFRSAIERGGLRFEVECTPLPEPIYVDPQMWEKVVLNLLSNAFKYTFTGHIRVATRWTGRAAVLAVEDTGAGIPPTELARVFDRFHRIESTRARTHEGTGIGLALVRDLVTLHGGEIEVDSEVGRGTTFTVTIPAGRAHLDPERIDRRAAPSFTAIGAQAFVVEAERWLENSSTAAPHPADAGASDAERTRPRIVLADDNADMRDYVRRLLGSRFEVEALSNGAEALAAVRRRRPDLVITDLMMPDLDGFELVSALRGDEGLRDLPILMLSARAGEESRLEGLQAGADDYMVKPFSARELLARIDVLLLRASIHAVESLQRRQLTDIFQQAPAAIAILRGPDHVYEFANPAYLALVGQRDVVGKPIRVALPELAGQGVYELLDGVFTSSEPHVGRALRLMVTRRPGAEPEESYFDFVYQPMRDAAGEIDGIAVVAFEVSDLVRARREAEAANRTKDEFLAMLGHELRNPLAPMLTALQLMRLRGDSAPRERVVIERQTRHLVRLVDDLLDVSRIARGKIDLRIERVDVADIVAKAIEMASPLLEERGHDLQVEVPRGLFVDADSARLAQVVANLLTNAAKYTEKGGVVAIRAASEGATVVLRVHDSGIGIAPDMLPRVFDMFTQERQALDRTQGGLGLGLTIVRNLTELHGGTVEAHSEGRNRGSEFVVRLPLAAAMPAGTDSTSARPLPAMVSGTAPSVLVVDDNEDAAAMLADYVESLGYRVRSVHDGPAALKAATEAAPDIALLDIGLPVMDGFELASRLRQCEAGADLKLVAITGYGQAADRERTRESGFDAHLVKPVDLDALAELLHQLSA